MSEGKAFRCEECGIVPDWRIERQGDAVVTWACAEHMSSVCAGLIRPWETATRMIVTWFTGERGKS